MPSHKASAGSRQQVFVLVGGTGDLAMRMLWPSLAMLDQDGFLSESLRVISVARENISTDVMADRIAEAVKKRIGKDLEDATLPRFRQRITHVALDAARDDWGPKLKAELGDVANLDIVFFLSVSPSLFKPICEHIVTAGLNHAPNRVVIEKPIGRDLESSKVINDSVGHAFEESRIFRIDHYLGKETVQNLIALRFGNTVFEPLWNAQSIDHVQISISETVGTGERLGYYDEYGAIRDMLQNHLLQLLCLIAMEPPATLDDGRGRPGADLRLAGLLPVAVVVGAPPRDRRTAVPGVEAVQRGVGDHDDPAGLVDGEGAADLLVQVLHPDLAGVPVDHADDAGAGHEPDPPVPVGERGEDERPAHGAGDVVATDEGESRRGGGPGLLDHVDRPL